MIYHLVADICTDDSTISSHSKSVEELTSTLSKDLNKIDHWCNLNNMAINVTKSKVMCVTSKHNQCIIPQNFPGISYKISYISVSNSEKLLGVTIDNTLSWSTQVDSVINKSNTSISFIPCKIIFVC